MDINNKSFVAYDSFEDEVTLCTVTMLGAVIQWQPRAEDVKEVCLETPHDNKIDPVIYNSYAFHDRYSYSLLNIWSEQLWASRFWANNKNYETIALRYVVIPKETPKAPVLPSKGPTRAMREACKCILL